MVKEAEVREGEACLGVEDGEEELGVDVRTGSVAEETGAAVVGGERDDRVLDFKMEVKRARTVLDLSVVG